MSLVLALGFMVVVQLGFALYHHCGSAPTSDTNTLGAIHTGHRHVGSAKAFGLAIPEEKHIKVSSVKELSQAFESHNYTLANVKSEGTAPRLYINTLPGDMKNKKKATNKSFIQVLLPHILKINELIMADRARLLEMQTRLKQGGHLRHPEKLWLAKLAADHRCKSTKIETLLMHVDIVPPSLALAQAIIETGGGRSHAALKKNSTFGHMATKTKVKAFDSLEKSVRAYVENLNAHPAYAAFRKDRASQRAQNQKLSGHKLATHLVKYSIRGTAYTKDLQRMITNQDLGSYDHITLDQSMRLKP
jgi:Bax protein